MHKIIKIDNIIKKFFLFILEPHLSTYQHTVCFIPPMPQNTYVFITKPLIFTQSSHLTLPTAGGFSVRPPCHYWSYTMSPSVSVLACPALPRFAYAKSRKPSFRIFFAALTSRSCSVPHCGHTHLRTDRSFVPSFRYPHAEHSWLDG